MFVTLLYILIELKEKLITIINAGHLPPLVRSGSDGEVAILDEVGGSPLGIIPDVSYQAQCRSFEPGDTILAYTDGVMEARNQEEEEFRLERLSQVLRDGPPDSSGVVQGIQTALQSFMGNQKQHDDVTMVCVGVDP